MNDNGPEIRKDAKEIIEKINSADLSDDECREIFKALKKQPEVIGGVVYTVADAQDYVANAVVNLMLPDTESSEKVYEKGTKRFCDKFHSFFEKEVIAEGESAMYDLAMRETYPEAVEAISMKKEKKEKADAKNC